MILQALSRFYETAGPECGLAPKGMDWKEISFVLVLKADGSLVDIEDTRQLIKNKLRGAFFLVPMAEKRSSGIAANLLWDTAEYALGICRADSKPERVREQHLAFLSRLKGISCLDVRVAAVRAFLQKLCLTELANNPCWAALSVGNPNVSFRLDTDPKTQLIAALPAVVASMQRYQPANDAGMALHESEIACETQDPHGAICLVRNQRDQVARLHPVIKGVWGAQTSGANLVSFNLTAFNAYGKQQGDNAPIGATAAFNYTTALNHLLRSDSKNRVQLADASVVFWSSEACSLVEQFSVFFNEPQAESAVVGINALAQQCHDIAAGLAMSANHATPEFYILGLAPNAARISVRFWLQDTVPNIAKRMATHFDDAALAVAGAAHKGQALPLWRLLASTALQGKSANVAANFAGDLLRAVLQGLPYPTSLLAAAIRRARAERSVPYARATLIKACLQRQFRCFPNQYPNQALSMNLNLDQPSTGYQIGRLFAALERIEDIAHPGARTTMRDRYFGQASATPGSVLPILFKLKNQHMTKLQNQDAKTWAEGLVTEIVGRLNRFPQHLGLQEQGLFAIGYYHQTQFFAATPEHAARAHS